MTLLDFVVLALATWRLSHMLVFEDGPGNILRSLRRWSGVPLGKQRIAAKASDEERDAYPFFAKLLVCPLCVSVSVAAGTVVVWTSLPDSSLVFWALAISGASSIISVWVQK